MRRFFTPGWLGLHALAVFLVTIFLALGWWQLQRAGEGNMRSWAYVFEWPLFAVFALAMWVKMIHDELTGGAGPSADADEAAGGPSGATGAPAAPGGGVAAEGPEDPELAAYNRYLARLDAEARQGGR